MLKRNIFFPVLFFLFIVASCTSAENKNGTAATNNEAAPATAQTDKDAPAENKLPAAALIDITGKAVDLKSFAGKKVFVNLWATWCPPCRAEMPSIEKLYEKVDKEKTAFVILSLDDNLETVKKYVQDKNVKLPVYYPNGNLPEMFNVKGIPATFIFNEKGELIEQREGAEDYDTEAYMQLFGS